MLVHWAQILQLSSTREDWSTCGHLLPMKLILRQKQPQTNRERKKERKTFMDEKNSFQKMFIIRVRVGSSQRVAPWPTNTAIYWFCCGTLLVRKCASPGTWLSQSNNSFWALSLPILSCLCWLMCSWYSVSKRKYIYRYSSALLRVESGLRFGGWAREPLLGAGIAP